MTASNASAINASGRQLEPDRLLEGEGRVENPVLRERQGAEHYSALDLGPEPLRAGVLVHAEEIAVTDSMSEPHAVVARQVRGRLRRCQNVIGRDPVGSVGQLGLFDAAAQLFDQCK